MQLFLIFAFAAMLCWGVGDFLLQRTARKTSSLMTLTFIGLVGIIALFPFIVGELAALDLNGLFVLVVLGAITFLAAMFDLEALRAGKIAVIDIIVALELPLTVIFGVAFFRETLTATQAVLIVVLLLGLIMVSFERNSLKGFTLEKGVYFGLLAAIGMALVNFLTAHAARIASPMMAIWFPAVVFTGVCLIALGTRGEITSFITSVRRFGWLFVMMAFIDTAAWVFYAYATNRGDLAITTAITESYPALALALGVYFNKEKLSTHQWVGVCVALGASVTLAILV